MTPDGKVLPCHAAETIPHLVFENVRDRIARQISGMTAPPFNAYPGRPTGCQEPCTSLRRARPSISAAAAARPWPWSGIPAATDPVCMKSPDHGALQVQADAHASAEGKDLVYRTAPGKPVQETVD